MNVDSQTTKETNGQFKTTVNTCKYFLVEKSKSGKMGKFFGIGSKELCWKKNALFYTPLKLMNVVLFFSRKK